MAIKKRKRSAYEDVAKPTRPLGKHGLKLWQSITSEYDIDDPGSLEMLLLACQSLDRAENIRAQIDEQGEIIQGKTGPKENPLLKAENMSRAFIVRTLAKLGLSVDPNKQMGRPPMQVSVGPDYFR